VAFGADSNKITIIDQSHNHYEYELKSKELVAQDIIDFIRQI
jgi:phosphopantothenoylcysteine synthetase/decarboxylase